MWYLSHNLPATPINPSTPSIALPRPLENVPTSTIASISALAPSVAQQTALSIVTPPAATRKVLEEAKQVGVRAVWLQPGSFDADGLAYARREWPDAAIGGLDVAGSRGGEGWCVLVDGEWGLRLAGREGGEKL